MTFWIVLFAADIPEKLGKWFASAKCVKIFCGKVTLEMLVIALKLKHHLFVCVFHRTCYRKTTFGHSIITFSQNDQNLQPLLPLFALVRFW